MSPDASTAIAAGDKLFIKTTDGGATWNYSNVTLDQTLTGIASLQSSIWAVGAKVASPKSTGILQSTDAGTSWTNKVNYAVFDSTNTVIDVTIAPSGAVYVCAGNSVIYSNAALTNVLADPKVPQEYSLGQNFPNPFNPATTISYQLPVRSNVRLTVYNILGKEIATLVSKVMEPGYYSVRFDASALSSGLYFYRLQSDKYTEVKKMMLIK